MEIEQTPLRTAIMRIMSDMLDNPDEHGIFETSRFMDRIEQLLCDMMSAPEVMQLSGSEAIFGLLGWLSTRDEVTTLGSSEAVDTDIISRFIDANNLAEPRVAWRELLTHPKSLEPEIVPEPKSKIIEEIKSSGWRPMFLGLGAINTIKFYGGSRVNDELDFDVGEFSKKEDPGPQSDFNIMMAEVTLLDQRGEIIMGGTFEEVLSSLIGNVKFFNQS